MAWSKIRLLPGVVKDESEQSVEGRIVETVNTRFYRGRIEKLGGWKQWGNDEIPGIVRGCKEWSDNDGRPFVAFGSQNHLYTKQSLRDAVDATPVALPRTAMENNSPQAYLNNAQRSVQVAFIAPANKVDEYEQLFEDGVRVKVQYYDANGNLLIEADGNIRAAANIDRQFQFWIDDAVGNPVLDMTGVRLFITVYLPRGLLDIDTRQGYGKGWYGVGFYGGNRATVADIAKNFPRVWSFANYGHNMLAMALGTKLFQFSPTDDDGIFKAIEEAPVGNFVFVTSERYAVILGRSDANIGGLIDDNMYISWHNSNSINDWTPGQNSRANIRRLQNGNIMVAGTALTRGINMMWSDTACFRMQFIGGRFVYVTEAISIDNAGLIGPQAFCVAQSTAFWMSSNNFYYSNGEEMRMMPNQNHIRDYVFSRMNELASYKNFAYYNKYFNEIWFFYCTGDEPEDYVIYHMDSQSWSIGSMRRSSACDVDIETEHPLKFGYNTERTVSKLYRHDFDQSRTRILNADGVPLTWSFKTARGGVAGMKRMTDIIAYQPDFETIEGDVTLTLRGYEYAMSSRADDEDGVDDDPGNPKTELVIDAEAIRRGRIDCRFNARLMSLEMKGGAMNGDFRLGDLIFDMSATAGRQ